MEVGPATSFLANFWHYSALPLTLKNYKIPKIGSPSTDRCSQIQEKTQYLTKKRDERLVAPRSDRADKKKKKSEKKGTKRRVEKTIDSDDDAPLSRRKRGRLSFKSNRIEDDEDIPFRFVTAADSEEDNVIRTVELSQEPAIDDVIPMAVCEEPLGQQDHETTEVEMPEAQRCTPLENMFTSEALLSEQTTHRREDVVKDHETSAISMFAVQNYTPTEDTPPETLVSEIQPFTEEIDATTHADVDVHSAPTRPQSPEAVSSLSEVDVTAPVVPTTDTSVQLPDSVTSFQRAALQQIMMKLKSITDARNRNEKDRKAAAKELSKLEADRQKFKDRVVTLSGKAVKDKHLVAEQIRQTESKKEHLVQLYVQQEAKLEELTDQNAQYDFETYESVSTAALNELDKIGHALNSINSELEELRAEHQSIVSAGDALEETRSNLTVLEKSIAELTHELDRLEAEKVTLDASHKDTEEEFCLEREKRRKIFKLVSAESSSSPSSSPMLSISSPSPAGEFHSGVADHRLAEVASPDSATSPSCMSSSQSTSSPVRIKSEIQRNQTPEEASKKLSSLFSKARLNPVVKVEKPHIALQKELMDAFEELVYNALLIMPVSVEAFISRRKSFLSMTDMEESSLLPVLYAQLQKKEGNNISTISYSVFEKEYKQRIAAQCSDETVTEANSTACATTTVPQPSTSAEPFQETSQWITTDVSRQLPVSQTSVSGSNLVSFSRHQASWTAPIQSVTEHRDRRQSVVPYFQQTSQVYGGSTQGNVHSTPLSNYSPSSTTHTYTQEVGSQYQSYSGLGPSGNQQNFIQQQISSSRGTSSMYTPASYATQQNSCISSCMSNMELYQQQQRQHSWLYADHASPQGQNGMTAYSHCGGSPCDLSVGCNRPSVDQAATMGSKCLVCSIKAVQVCSRCNIAAYCSRDCQVCDWPRHKMTCGQQVMKKSPNSR